MSAGCFHSSSLTSVKDDLFDKDAWEKFYASRLSLENFDWFLDFHDIAENLIPLIPQVNSVRILDIGCGTSHFGMELYQHLKGNCHIDCVDFSDTAISQMNQLLAIAKKAGEIECNKKQDSGLFYFVADIKNLPFKSNTFHVVVDKGTSDAVLRGHKGEDAFYEIFVEALRVLKPDGKLIQFTDEDPELRLDLLAKFRSQLQVKVPHLQIVYKELGVTFGVDHFMYTIEKC